MKRIITILILLSICVSVSARNRSEEKCHCSSHEPAQYEESPQSYEQIPCPTCEGKREVIVGYNMYGYAVWGLCERCEGRGWVLREVQKQRNTIFGSRVPYYAECYANDNGKRCKCKFFVPNGKGSTMCVCGHLKSSHAKKYL